MFKDFAEVKQYIEENDVKMVDFMMIDLDGRWRHLTIPAQRFNESILAEGDRKSVV